MHCLGSTARCRTRDNRLTPTTPAISSGCNLAARQSISKVVAHRLTTSTSAMAAALVVVLCSSAAPPGLNPKDREGAAVATTPDINGPLDKANNAPKGGSGSVLVLGKPWPTRVVAKVASGWAGVLPNGSVTAVGLAWVGPTATALDRLESVDLVTGATKNGPEVTEGTVVMAHGEDVYLFGPAELTADGAALGPTGSGPSMSPR